MGVRAKNREGEEGGFFVLFFFKKREREEIESIGINNEVGCERNRGEESMMIGQLKVTG